MGDARQGSRGGTTSSLRTSTSAVSLVVDGRAVGGDGIEFRVERSRAESPPRPTWHPRRSRLEMLRSSRATLS